MNKENIKILINAINACSSFNEEDGTCVNVVDLLTELNIKDQLKNIQLKG